MSNIFLQAAKLKLRFATPVGNLSVEDLFDLPLDSKTGKPNLYAIGNELNKQLQQASGNIFSDDNTTDAVTQLRFDIVKEVIELKKAERQAAQDAKTRADQKQKLLEVIAKKKGEALEGKDLAELEKELAALG